MHIYLKTYLIFIFEFSLDSSKKIFNNYFFRGGGGWVGRGGGSSRKRSGRGQGKQDLVFIQANTSRDFV